jgi:hypothetical protein
MLTLAKEKLLAHGLLNAPSHFIARTAARQSD